MRFPRQVAQFNKYVNNRVQGVYAWLLPPWAVVLHRGRRSGIPYRTPVLAFRKHDTLVIALLYGRDADWLRNLRAGGGRVVRRGRTVPIVGRPEVVDTADAGVLQSLAPPIRAYCRVSNHQALLVLGESLPGFGPGQADQVEPSHSDATSRSAAA